jgi:hypothetical protein
MIKLLIFLMVTFSFSANAKFIHPKEFDGSEAQKREVVSYIKNRVKQDYCETLDMCQEVMLRMMETENLKAFKNLIKAKNRKVLDRAIHDYCGSVDMCTYQMIEMMYNENIKAQDQELSW